MSEFAPKPVNVKLFRHGETRFHGTKRVAGGMVDVPLNDTGVQQAVALGERTRGERYTEVHSSPLVRAVDTARPIAAAHGFHDIQIVPALRERRFGKAIEDLTDEDELTRVRDELRSFWHLPPSERMDVRLTPDMETDRQVLRRVRGYLRDQTPGAAIGAATHWDVISTLTLHETDKLISPENASGVTLHVVRDEITVVDMHGNKPVFDHAA